MKKRLFESATRYKHFQGQSEITSIPLRSYMKQYFTCSDPKMISIWLHFHKLFLRLMKGQPK